MKRKKLTELYHISEGSFDDINKSLSGAKSVAQDPRTKPRVGVSGAAQKAQADLDQSKSIFDEDSYNEALGEGGTTAVNLTKSELRNIAVWADEYSFQPGVKELLKKIEDAISQAGGPSGGSSMSMSRTTTKQGF